MTCQTCHLPTTFSAHGDPWACIRALSAEKEKWKAKAENLENELRALRESPAVDLKWNEELLAELEGKGVDVSTLRRVERVALNLQ